MIARNIVDELIATLYFHLDDDAADGDDAKLFKLDQNYDNSASGATHSVTIKNTERFWLGIDDTSTGLLF
jgi:hypothetical protein